MSVIDDLKPTSKHLIMDLLDEAGFDVSDWRNYRGQHAASNPKSYNWSFEQPGEKIALCLWHRSIKRKGNEIYHHSTPQTHTGPALKRAQNMRQQVRLWAGAATVVVARKFYGIRTPEEFREPSLFDFGMTDANNEAGIPFDQAQLRPPSTRPLRGLVFLEPVPLGTHPIDVGEHSFQ